MKKLKRKRRAPDSYLSADGWRFIPTIGTAFSLGATPGVLTHPSYVVIAPVVIKISTLLQKSKFLLHLPL
jgi:hypothetical protein